MSNDGLDVSVVLPVHNERGHVLEEIDRIRVAMDSSPYSYEIVVVDDGSTDGSSELLADVPDIRLLRFADNRGAGFARRVGTQVARGKVVVWTDVDMSYPNEQLPDLVAQLDGYDQVVGARTSERGTSKFARVPAKWLIRKLAEVLSGRRIADLNSGMRAFRRSVADQFLHLMPSGFSHVTTLTMVFLANGYSIRYVPVEYYRRAGHSKFHWFADTYTYVLQVIRMAMMFSPLKVFLPAGLSVFFVGVGKLTYDIVTKEFRIAGNTLVLLLIAVGLFIVGLLADLIVQLNRPANPVLPATVKPSDAEG